MHPIRTALIGLGYWGPNLLRVFSAEEGCELAVACDRAAERIDQMKKKYPSLRYGMDAEEIFADPSIELVLIATPTSTHFDLAMRALAAGKHVFVEKPMTATLDQAEELVRFADTQGKKLFVDHTFVFSPAVQKMQELVKEGAIGESLYFDSRRINLGLIQKDTNALFDLAIHDLSILGSLVDLDNITNIAAHGRKHFGVQEEDVHLHLQFRSGFHAHIHVSWLSPVKVRQTILAGKRAMIVYDDTQPSEKIRVYDSGIEHDQTKPDPFFPKYRTGDILIPTLQNLEPLAVEAAHIVRSVRGTVPPISSGDTALKILRTLFIADALLKQTSSSSSPPWDSISNASVMTSHSAKTSSSAIS